MELLVRRRRSVEGDRRDQDPTRGTQQRGFGAANACGCPAPKQDDLRCDPDGHRIHHHVQRQHLRFDCRRQERYECPGGRYRPLRGRLLLDDRRQGQLADRCERPQNPGSWQRWFETRNGRRCRRLLDCGRSAHQRCGRQRRKSDGKQRKRRGFVLQIGQRRRRCRNVHSDRRHGNRHSKNFGVLILFCTARRRPFVLRIRLRQEKDADAEYDGCGNRRLHEYSRRVEGVAEPCEK